MLGIVIRDCDEKYSPRDSSERSGSPGDEARDKDEPNGERSYPKESQARPFVCIRQSTTEKLREPYEVSCTVI